MKTAVAAKLAYALGIPQAEAEELVNAGLTTPGKVRDADDAKLKAAGFTKHDAEALRAKAER